VHGVFGVRNDKATWKLEEDHHVSSLKKMSNLQPPFAYLSIKEGAYIYYYSMALSTSVLQSSCGGGDHEREFARPATAAALLVRS
jgi:hypothetical protein